MATKRDYRFNIKHLITYGLVISQRCSKMENVIGVACNLCIFFEKQQNEDSEIVRKRSKTNKYFTHPFRTENYLQHLKLIHKNKWLEYQSLCTLSKQSYFTEKQKNQISNYFIEPDNTVKIFISKDIIELIFKHYLSEEEYEQDITNLKKYLPCKIENDILYIHITNKLQFQLIINHISIGSSFRNTVRALTFTKELTGMVSIGCTHSDMVRKYTRSVCLINLERIKEILSKVWCFSIALDMATCQNSSYLDLRIRLFYNEMVNLHILAVPMPDHHTADAIYKVYNQSIRYIYIIYIYIYIYIYI